MGDWMIYDTLAPSALEGALWRGEARDALHALDRFADAEGFVPYSDLIDPRDNPLSEEERRFVFQMDDGTCHAVFTNMNIAAVEVPERQRDAERRIAERIEEGLEAWRSGRMTSPSERDHVLDAVRVLGLSLTDQTIEALAEKVFVEGSEGTMSAHPAVGEPGDEDGTLTLARWLYAEIGPAPMRHMRFTLDVFLPEGDARSEAEIKQTLAGVLSVGSDSDEARDLDYSISIVEGVRV